MSEVNDQDLLRDINSARLYMKAATLADVVSLDVATIIEGAWNMEGPIRDSRWEWPTQEKPSYVVKRIWQKMLGNLTDKKRKLRKPLGRWTAMGHQKWEYG